MTGKQLPMGIKELDELDLLVIVDNETDTLSSVDPEVPQIPEIIQAATRTAPSRYHDGHACRVVMDKLCCACHGFSVLVTGRSGSERHSMLFDVGPYPDVWLDNARRLDVDLADIETLFLSHWHFDHSGGFPEVVRAIAQARSMAGRSGPLVVDLHPQRPDQRGQLAPNGEFLMLPVEPGFCDIESAGGVVSKNSESHSLCGGLIYASGAIPRVTPYETGLPGHYSFHGDNARLDPLIMDERFIAACVRGRGVSLLSACSHAGIVNVCLAAQQAFPGQSIDAVLGGYHLAGKVMELRIEDTVRDLEARIRPRIVAPGHCTGWRAKAALAARFAPGRYGPSMVGTRFRLTAS